ncbi:MAG: IS66 family transposase [Epibacterium sp.]|nr:IS66 family transposase [Epibacterium sp.]NQX75456.1 IS66 family transposase [Epibacterium sp.]
MPSDAQRIAQLEAQVRRQQARIDQLERQVEQLTHERDVAREELNEERLQHKITRQHLRELTEAVQALSGQHRRLLRRTFGTSSERVAGIQGILPGFLEEVDPDFAAAEQAALDAATAAANALSEAAASDDTQGDGVIVSDSASADDENSAKTKRPAKTRTRPVKSGGRNDLPEDLPRQEVFYQPDPATHPYLNNVKKFKELRRKIISRLVIEPVQVVVRDISCPVMTLTFPNGIRTQQTITPPSVIHCGQADDSVLIHSACDKILDYLPAYRQSQRFARSNITLHRSKLCRWHQALATFLAPVADAIFHEIIASTVVGIDDTIHRLVDAELHRCKNGRLWAATNDTSCYYWFAETREGKWLDGLLGDYEGAIIGDAYAGHRVLLERDHVVALFCWAHVRRKFFEADNSPKRDQALRLIGQLYDIEREIAALPPDKKVARRTRHAKPILAKFKELLDAWQTDRTVLPKTGLGIAVTYASNQWHGLQTYCTIGEAPIDNNRTERVMRPNALHRKNSLFSASKAGAEAYATLSTVIHTAHSHGLNPYTYLTDIVDDMHYNRRPPEDLTPAAYAKRAGAEITVK